MEKALELVLSKIGIGFDVALPLYSKWYFVHNLAKVAISIPLFVIAYFVFINSDINSDDDPDYRYRVAAGILIVFGVMFIVFNIADVIYPEARAIHELLKDIRGK